MKDKKNFFINKFLFIFILFLLYFFIFSTSSFANSDVTFTNSTGSNITISLPDEYFSSTYRLILEGSYESLYPHYYIYYGEYPCFIDDSFSSANSFVLTTCSIDKKVTFGHYYGKDIANPSFSYENGYIFALNIDNFDVPRYKFLECNYAIRLLSNNEVVFQGAPVTVEQITIPAIQQVEEIPQAMTEVMKIMIPIGLIVLLIGLVIYLTRYVISRAQ